MRDLPKILVYHAVCEDRDFPTGAGTNVAPENFKRQMEHLGRFLLLSSLKKTVDSGNHRAIAVTFDDGYADNYTTSYPIIKKFAVPVTFFLTVGMVGKDWDFPRGLYPGLSWEEIREMGDDPLIDFGSHGYRHIDLTRIPEEESFLEIKSSRILLEENIGKTVRFFSYPHGSYNEEIIEQVRAAGYQEAFSVIPQKQGNFSRRRILISSRDTIFRFKLKLSPLYWPLRKII